MTAHEWIILSLLVFISAVCIHLGDKAAFGDDDKSHDEYDATQF